MQLFLAIVATPDLKSPSVKNMPSRSGDVSAKPPTEEATEISLLVNRPQNPLPLFKKIGLVILTTLSFANNITFLSNKLIEISVKLPMVILLLAQVVSYQK